MALNIKNAVAEALIKQLAEQTGESQTTAVTVAVRERLERLTQQKPVTAEEILAIGQACAQRLREPLRSANLDDWLYDERGLPK